jgi:hypothetical protein
MGFDRFDGVSGKRPSRGIDIRKNYISSFPEFGDKTKTLKFDVIPVFEEGKPIHRRPVTVLESKEVKDRHAAIKAELGLTGTGRNLRPIAQVQAIQKQHEDAVNDIRYYQDQLGTEIKSWDDF